MHICFVLEYYHPHVGGVEYLFQNLAEGLRNKGHDVTVLTRRLPGTPHRETLGGVNIIRMRTLNRYLFTFLAIPRAVFLTRKCDVIHTTTYNGAFPARIASGIWRIPSVITVHEVWLNKWRTLTDMGHLSAAIHNLLERMIYFLRFDLYITVSRSTEKQLREVGVPGGLVKTIYNGFDNDFFGPDRYLGEPIRQRYGLQDAFVCFSWGRPGVSKGHEHLLNAMPLIVEKVPNAKLLLMLSGRDSYRKRYHSLVQLILKLNITERVVLIPPVSRQELGHYLQAADCVIIPSLAEGFGYAVLEACTAGRPVVASNTTSIPEVIGGRYVLVEPKNPAAIAGGVVRVSEGKYETSEVKVFPWEKAVSEYVTAYEKLRGKSE